MLEALGSPSGHHINQMGPHRSVISALGRWRQGDQKFKDILQHLKEYMRFCQKKEMEEEEGKRRKEKGEEKEGGDSSTFGGWGMEGPDQNPHGLPDWGRVWPSVVTKVSIY